MVENNMVEHLFECDDVTLFAYSLWVKDVDGNESVITGPRFVNRSSVAILFQFKGTVSPVETALVTPDGQYLPKQKTERLEWFYDKSI